VLFDLRVDLLVRFRILDAGCMVYDVASWIRRLEDWKEVLGRSGGFQ
jgi:hypothetical protein